MERMGFRTETPSLALANFAGAKSDSANAGLTWIYICIVQAGKRVLPVMLQTLHCSAL